MNAFCGLDFGTSNSTVGIYQSDAFKLVPLENGKPIMRSAMFCDFELKKWIFGQSGINAYLESTPGRLMMSLKSVLGSSLMKEKTVIFDEYVPYTNVLAAFLANIKNAAENQIKNEITKVVIGRPVYFHDDDKIKDQMAQDTLESIAKDLGFKDIAFQYEPIGAALAYESTLQKEQLALIIDMGGGTSDFSVIRLNPKNKAIDRSSDVLSNCGIHIAGTDFDKKLGLHSVMPLLGLGSQIKGSSSIIEFPSWYFHDLSTWHTLTGLYDGKTVSHIETLRSVALKKELISRLIHTLKKKAGHHILNSVEMAKQTLSSQFGVKIDLSYIENELVVFASQADFNAIISDQLEKIIERIKETVLISGVSYGDIDAIFYTGGTTKIPIVHEKISALFPNATVMMGDSFGSVGLGLTIDAKRRYAM